MQGCFNWCSVFLNDSGCFEDVYMVVWGRFRLFQVVDLLFGQCVLQVVLGCQGSFVCCLTFSQLC